MVKAKVYVLKKHFEGFPKPDDLEVIEEVLPAIKNGEFLAEAVYLSVDPYMWAFASSFQLGQTFTAAQVAKIIQSKNPKYPEGHHVVGQFGWRTHTISDGSTSEGIGKDRPPTLVLKDLPLSLALGAAGTPGNTAYFGFLELCRPRPGETVVVSAAAGAVGSHVGQIAKIKECTVIGIAGSDEKGRWLVDELGFDHFINYKTEDIDAALKKLAPNGVDCYFDNVSGEISSNVIMNMNSFGRISICGAISAYNKDIKATSIYEAIVPKQLTMEGFHVARWSSRWNEGVKQNIKWIKEGKIKYRETVTEGFENTSKAFIEMLNGKNTGKAVVKV